MEHENQEILRRLDKIQIDINFIKNNMIDADYVLTDEERNELEEARKEYERGETTSLEDFEKEMELIHKHK
ncbi:MAG: hypothetical protein Q8N99_07550 [Nanoarchaeota archaeon]|nr:hypothetical protein [Nanoarchaeota archaeon]